MNLSVDIGNTDLKLCVISKGKVIDSFRLKKYDITALSEVFERYKAIGKAIMVCSGERCEDLESVISSKVEKFMIFSSQTPTPIANLYATPESLGSDRLAAGVGAKEVFGSENVLIIDFGTAITVDVVNKNGEYLGGNISLGLNSRYRALNEYTFSLPLCSSPDEIQMPASDSVTAIESGVVLSVIYEIEGYIREYSSRFEDLKVVFTGGDGEFFAQKINYPITVESNLVSLGLNRILEYNED
ncbi:MAG: type III pantothenate kinase [Rikenellaceae bacterium]